ncbi:MAG: hypothetical protein IKM02_01095 [Clostridia bacterium]|nr:hypothetical protein [Clostridia bacterium]
MDNQNRPAPSENKPAKTDSPKTAPKTQPRRRDVRIHYSRLSGNSRYRRRSLLNRFISSISNFWPIYASAAGIIIAVALLVILIPGTIKNAPAYGEPNPPVSTQEPAETPEPTHTPEPTSTPEPTQTPEPTEDPEPEVDTEDILPLDALPTFAATVTMSPEYEVLKGVPDTDRVLGLPECELVDHSYFNDTVFIGDSVSEKLRLYVS